MTDADLDRITRELADVQDALLALGEAAFAARYALLKRQDELREQAARFAQDWDAQRTTRELLTELDALRANLSAIESEQIDMVKQLGGGTAAGPGADGWGGVALNQQMATGLGKGELQARIGRIKGILIDRGVDPDQERP